ncbi:uncharacterized protein LOC119662294 [Teleopsis dalmanni]|uniref:uncharacterized protein LOC119662294 n=1 Tax=Teleopsis dalmanni TaxID=139649 RepID=UPI0018CF8406|nr:uncharacterized protein LOC119662294 [Teleopsis dalmanni]
MDSKKTPSNMRNFSRKVSGGNDRNELSLKRSVGKKNVKSFKEYADHIKSEIQQSKSLTNFETLGGRQSLRTSTSNSRMKLRYGIEGSLENNPKSAMSNISVKATKSQIGVPSPMEIGNVMEEELDFRPSTSKASLAYRNQYAANNLKLKPDLNQLSYGRSEGFEDDKPELTVLMRNLSFRETIDAQDELDLRPSTSKGSINAGRRITRPAENKIRVQRSVSNTGMNVARRITGPAETKRRTQRSVSTTGINLDKHSTNTNLSKISLNSRISGLQGFPLYPGIPNEKPHTFSTTKLKTLESFPLKKDHNFKEMSKLLDKCNTQMEKIRSSELESYVLDQNLFNLQTEFIMKREKFNDHLAESRKQEPEE